MVDVKSMSLEELSILAEDISHELKKRKDMRFHELASAVVDAFKALKAEFPYASYGIEIDVEDGDCGYVDFDVMGIDFVVSKFTK